MSEMQQLITNELTEANSLLYDFISNKDQIRNIEQAAELLITSLSNGNKIFTCGNGGSMCDAMHFAEELTGRFRQNRKAIAAIAISDPSHITCTANDYGFEYIFSRYLEAHGKKGDALVAISTSGNSANVIEAARYAKENQMTVISLTGKDGGKLTDFSNCNINVAHQGYADRIQEIHIKIIHILIHLIEIKLTQ